MSNAVSTARQRGRAPATSEQNVTSTALHPIYGITGSNGAGLERYPVSVLALLHAKAMRLSTVFINERGGDEASNSAHYDALYNAQWDTLNAALAADLNNGRDVATVLGMIASQAQDSGDLEWLKIDDLKQLACRAEKATAPVLPTKATTALQRGRKLTAFGLIHRYQAFLIQELETIGWHVYGARDYPLFYRPFDSAVNTRCRTPDGRGRSPIFFNTAKLKSRASAVLRSLKIDTVKGGDTP
ncbi:hypothetical protein ABIB06_004890 [Bradyrhizobium sp. LB8.2]|uniref:hypothetical protein n=1 Tax=Bradyrhizobium sp. LB8.2 TaxID=3156330 RepID=UPI003395D3CD